MTYIITDPCVGTCDTACVEVCPVDCIHGPDDPEGSGEEAKEDGYDATNKQLYINPEECIDCGACEPECPVDAIYDEDEVPEDQIPYIELNAELCMEWPNIVEQKNPLPDSDEWKEVKGKFKYLHKSSV